MKKTLALVLAGVMAAGMTTTAFAVAEPQLILGYTTSATTFEGDKMYTLNEDGDETRIHNGEVVKSGETIYVPVVMWTDVEGEGENKIGANELTLATSDDVSRIKYFFESDLKDGNDQDGDLVPVKINGTRYYCAVIEVPENNGSKNLDLEGTLAIGRRKNAALDEDNSLGQMEISLAYGPKADDEATPIDGDMDIDDSIGIVKFDSDLGEIVLTFGDIAEFEVDVTGQGRLNLAWNTTFDKEFAAWYDYANIDFLTFTGEPSFNKTGTLYIYAPEDAFVYGKGADGAVDVGAKWNEDYEAWEIRTRTLDAFVISDVELDEKTVTEDKDDTTTEDGNKQNPDTGR